MGALTSGPYTAQVILTVIENSASVPLDRFAGWLAEAPEAPDIEIVRAWDGDAIPTLAECGDGLLVLGGLQHAYDDARLPVAARDPRAARRGRPHRPAHARPVPRRPAARRGDRRRRAGRSSSGARVRRHRGRAAARGRARPAARRARGRRAGRPPARRWRAREGAVHARRRGGHPAARRRLAGVLRAVPVPGVPGRVGGVGPAVPPRGFRADRARLGRGAGRRGHRRGGRRSCASTPTRSSAPVARSPCRSPSWSPSPPAGAPSSRAEPYSGSASRSWASTIR